MADTITAEILKKCLEIHQQRDTEYGHSEESFANIAMIANRTTLSDKKFTTLDIAVCMVATKEARYKYILRNVPDNGARDILLRDTVIDWINYIAIMENIRCSDNTEVRVTDAYNQIPNP